MHVNVCVCVCVYIHVSVIWAYSFVSNQQNMLEGICTQSTNVLMDIHADIQTCTSSQV